MQHDEFKGILDAQLERVRDILVVKTEEYATADQLHNFVVSSELQDCSIPQALVGMMSKHTVSVYDMVNGGQTFPLNKWDEKITDHIVYLILLRAAVQDQTKE